MRFIVACILNAVSADSPCYGMLASCCLPRKEEELKNAVRIEYQNKLQVAFEKRAGQKCKRAGRNFERKTKTHCTIHHYYTIELQWEQEHNVLPYL